MPNPIPKKVPIKAPIKVPLPEVLVKGLVRTVIGVISSYQYTYPTSLDTKSHDPLSTKEGIRAPRQLLRLTFTLDLRSRAGIRN